MAGMWELPSISVDQLNRTSSLYKLRHSITDTDYQVSVYERKPE